MTLRARLLDVLDCGGPRKPAILRAAAEKRGEGAQFDATIAQLKAENRIRLIHRNGGPHYALVRERGFGQVELAVGLVVLAAIGVALWWAYQHGLEVKQAEWDRDKLAAIAAGQARDRDVSDAIKEKEAQRAMSDARAAENDRKWKEALRDSRRNKVALGSCVESKAEPVAGADGGMVAGGTGVMVGIKPAAAPDGAARAPGIRLHWRFVGLHDGAFTGLDGEPLYRDSAKYAGDAARADTPSPYGLDELIEVVGENARALSKCRLEYFTARNKLVAAEAAFKRTGP